MKKYTLSYPILDISDFHDDLGSFLEWASENEAVLLETKYTTVSESEGKVTFDVEAASAPDWYPHDDVKRSFSWRRK